ncbi:MAG: hypothetical protein ABIS18_03055 [Actinomycetota bacterium]
MKKLRPEEEWARRVIEADLGLTVRQHDDGSVAAMHDLDIIRGDEKAAAVEVTAAADAESIEWWNLANGTDGRWIAEGIRGGWMISAEPSSKVKRLRSELPKLLSTLESQGIDSISVEDWRTSERPEVKYARSLGVATARQGGTDFAGSIYLTVQLPIERSAGFVADDADAAAAWIGTFLREPEQSDVLVKLSHSGCNERHAFVILPGFTSAPFPVFDLFIRDEAPLPTINPDLPPEVTDVWIVSTWTSGQGLSWSKSGWRRFPKVDHA